LTAKRKERGTKALSRRHGVSQRQKEGEERRPEIVLAVHPTRKDSIKERGFEFDGV